MAEAQNAILNQILGQLQALQQSQQTLQAKVSSSSSSRTYMHRSPLTGYLGRCAHDTLYTSFEACLRERWTLKSGKRFAGPDCFADELCSIANIASGHVGHITPSQPGQARRESSGEGTRESIVSAPRGANKYVLTTISPSHAYNTTFIFPYT
jgi:hypothetical protein